MADDPSAADRNVEIWKIKKLIKSLEAARGWALRPAPPCPLGTRTPQDGRPRAAWPDEKNQALANSRLLDLWVVVPDPKVRVYVIGTRRGPSPACGSEARARGSDHSPPLWQATVTFILLLGPWVQLLFLRAPGAATHLGCCWEKGHGLPFRTPFLDFLPSSPFTFLSQASLKWPLPPGLLGPGWVKFAWGRKER